VEQKRQKLVNKVAAVLEAEEELQ